MNALECLTSVPDRDLLVRLSDLVRESRSRDVELIAHIGEVDARRLYAREACSSMFAYCTEILRLSEAEAYLRITAARTARQHPMVLDMLADGRLNLSAVGRLAPHLTVANRESVLGRATHKSKREILELVAELAPRPDAPSTIRRLPDRHPSPEARPDDRAAAGPTKLGLADSLTIGPPAAPAAGAPEALVARAPSTQLCPDAVAGASAPALASERATGRDVRPSTGRSAAIEPTSPGRYRVQFTASPDLRAKLERLQQLMRATDPQADLAEVIEAAVTEKLERLEARRLAKTERPHTHARDVDVTPRVRHVPAAVRRAVRERDGDRCRYVDASGRRCAEQTRLEFHHRHPYGLGGDHGVDNVCLMCRTHNRLLAEADYGRAGPHAGREGPRSASSATRAPGPGARATEAHGSL
jgi:hypothetical protein